MEEKEGSRQGAIVVYSYLLKKGEGSIWEMQKRDTRSRLTAQRSAVEGVVIVAGRPEIERADMPMALSFDTIEDLERFCMAAKCKDKVQH